MGKIALLVILHFWFLVGVLVIPVLAPADSAGYSTPGTSTYPGVGLTPIGTTTLLDEHNLRVALSDASKGYVYYGTYATPGRIIKVAMGQGTAAPTRIGAVTLEFGEDQLAAGVIDKTHGYAYFGTYTTPAKVIKVALGDGDEPPRRIGSITLDAGESLLHCAIIDEVNGYACFGTASGVDKIVKISLGSGDALPTRVSALALASQVGSLERRLNCAVADPVHGYAYFGADTGAVIKIAPGAGPEAPRKVSTYHDSSVPLLCAAAPPLGGYVYFGVLTGINPNSEIWKFSTGEGDNPPTRLGIIYPGAAATKLEAVEIDSQGRFGYFMTSLPYPKLLKVDLGIGDALPSVLSVKDLQSASGGSMTAVLDEANGYGYFSAGVPSSVAKFSLGTDSTPPVLKGRLSLPANQEDHLQAGVIDEEHGYAYFGTYTVPGWIVKVALGAGGEPARRVAAIPLNTGEDYISCAVIDKASGFAYFGTNVNSARLIQVKLGDGDAPPTRTKSALFGKYFGCAVIDSAGRYAYVGENAYGTIDIFDLKFVTFERYITIPQEDTNLTSAVIDNQNKYAYFGSQYGSIIKLPINGNQDHAPVSFISTLDSGLHSAVIDVNKGYAYFAVDGQFPYVSKVSLGAGASAPTHVGTMTWAVSGTALRGAVLDAANGFAYFSGGKGEISKLTPGNGTALPTRVGAINVNALGGMHTTLIDAGHGYIYIGTDSETGQIVKIALHQNGFLKGTQFTMPEESFVDDVRLYSHSASGEVRLSLYNNEEPKRLLWKSNVMTNGVDDGELVIPISSGSPPTLFLRPGTYWAAWQIEAGADVPSLSVGSSGEGFSLATSFQDAPASLSASAITSTDERWTEYITFKGVFPLPDSWMLF